MKKIIDSLIICFSMYSKIPVKNVEWEENNMKYVFCFFPLIGFVIGAFQLIWFYITRYFGFSHTFYAAVAVVIPLLITGGIHMDGYMDTCDAYFSYGSTEKRLQIMKDPHSGAFAVIYCSVYLLLSFGLFSQIIDGGCIKKIIYIGLGYMLSRSISGLLTVSMPCAKNSGLAHIFQNNASRNTAKIFLAVWIAVLFSAIAVILFENAVFAALLLLIQAAVYIRMVKKKFGGITGDLSGFSLQMSELMLLISAVI